MTDVKTTIEETIEKIIDEVKQERDEVKVKLHLAKLDASDEWSELENKLEKLENKAKELGGVTLEASQDVGAAAKLLGEEILNGFKSIGKHL